MKNRNEYVAPGWEEDILENTQSAMFVVDVVQPAANYLHLEENDGVPFSSSTFRVGSEPREMTFEKALFEPGYEDGNLPIRVHIASGLEWTPIAKNEVQKRFSLQISVNDMFTFIDGRPVKTEEGIEVWRKKEYCLSSSSQQPVYVDSFLYLVHPTEGVIQQEYTATQAAFLRSLHSPIDRSGMTMSDCVEISELFIAMGVPANQIDVQMAMFTNNIHRDSMRKSRRVELDG